MTVSWPVESPFPQLPFRRLFAPIERKVPEGAAIVTAYTDGQVTLRSNRSKTGYHEATDLSGFQGVRKGDFVVHGLDIMRGSVGVSDSDGALSAVCTVCRPIGPALPEYAALVMRLQAAHEYPKALARGVREGGADFRRWQTMAELPLLVPPLKFQAGVLRFLDRETAQIDELIGKQERLVETLRERRASVIDDTFARALPGSPITQRLGRVAMVNDCDHTTPEVTSEATDFEAVRTGSVRQGRYRPEHSLRVAEATWRVRNVTAEPHEGDVLFTREAPAGEACMVPVDRKICLGQRMVLISPRAHVIDGRFLMWQLYSRPVQDYFRMSMNGSTVGNLRLGLIRATPLQVPSVTLQRALVGRLEDVLLRIDALIAKAEQFIALAKERRSALITAAVTGQIDVRSAA